MATSKSKQPMGPKSLAGSDEAKRKAAVILEAIGGLRTTQSASDELGIALMRYYVLETRMMQAMIDALEPKARGRKRSVEKELTELREDKRRLEREVMRLQALYRVTQRAVGVRAEPKGKAVSKKKTRKARRQSRGERILKSLRNDQGSAPEGAATMRADERIGQGGA